ncbi:predicted protein [Nematostella vectensis]|uniref:Tesmin/TSO1-like CXC domain-containing protein n=1 Tax=Nematostella vectensis TaxID=45351 RepID=A7SU32_NEMVE|nr:predicted protein [Nematostella vectensis]|eukprot:XP_001624902.1 predicted protein [Nematostella vectensis]
MVTELQDHTILPRISGAEDLMAADAIYHFDCMTDLRNRYRSHVTRNRVENLEREDEKIKESQAYVELTEYIKDSATADGKSLESNVASSGEADSFLRVTYLKDQKLKSEAFSHSGDQLTTAEWEQTMKSSPTFRFWNAILHYQMLVLLVVRAQRQRNFVLYVEALEKLVPLFFVLDHVNYARWTPIHIRDMKSLPQSITEKFQDEGQFVLSRTGYDFSAMPFDQAHEQENKIVKSAGGAVGLTENPTAFRYSELINISMSLRIINDMVYYRQYLDDTDSETGDRTNHETGLSSQKTFKIQVNNLIDVIRKMGNPFLDNFPELVTLDSRDCMDNEVAETIVNLDALGKSQYSSFLKDDALLQHVKRCIYPAGIWTSSEISQPVLPSPDQFAWIKEAGTWVPRWITIPEVSKACNELTKCSCKGVCTRCKCIKAHLECTLLCKCKCRNT